MSEPSIDKSLLSPVEEIDTRSTHTSVEEGIGLCLSGGGYRAMLFHVGSLWRLNEAGYLRKIDRISSVSGGSITAAMLGCCWNQLEFGKMGVAQAFHTRVVTPIRAMAEKTVDVGSVIFGILMPGTVTEKVRDYYQQYLYGDKTLQDLPDDPPRFVINATNVQSGALWRFMKPYMRDWRVGEVKRPQLPLATAVAASSAFPPFLSPLKLKLDSTDYTPDSGADLQSAPFMREPVLTDGGVYDNLGLETVWKRYRTVLVSDAGGYLEPEAHPKTDWARHTVRVLFLIDNQVRSLRKRQTIHSFIVGSREGAYWGIRSNIADFGLPDALECPFPQTLALANLPTRLKRIEPLVQERLINWGYAVCDAAIRRHVDPEFPRPTGFPFPVAGVG